MYTRRSKAELAAAGHHAGKKRNFQQADEEDETHTGRKNAHHQDNPNSTGTHKDPRGRKKKRTRHPTAPKHPMSGFLFYASYMRPSVTEQHPGSTVGPISKIIAEHWRNLTPEERAPWEEKAAEDKKRYAREMEVYLSQQKDE